MKSFRIDPRKSHYLEQELPHHDSPEPQPWLIPPSTGMPAPRSRSFSDSASPLSGPLSGVSTSMYFTPPSSPNLVLPPSRSIPDSSFPPPRKRAWSHETGIPNKDLLKIKAKSSSQSSHNSFSLSPSRIRFRGSFSPDKHNNSLTNTPTMNNVRKHNNNSRLTLTANETPLNSVRFLNKNQSSSSMSIDSDYPIEDDFNRLENISDSNSLPSTRSVQSSNMNTEEGRSRFRKCFKFCDNNRSLTRISSFIVRYAPCFLGCRQPFEVSATDRFILFRLNVLIAFFAFVQVIVGAFFGLVMYSSITGISLPGMGGSHEDDKIKNNNPLGNSIGTSSGDDLQTPVKWRLDPNIWNCNLSLIMIGFIGLVLLLAVIFARKVIKEVDLGRALRYHAFLRNVLPFEIVSVLNLLDFHGVTRVWIKHWWSSESFAWFRSQFCTEFAHTKCLVPKKGSGDFTSTMAWCQSLYNATDCLEIRENAEEDMTHMAYVVYAVSGAWGILLIILIFLSMRALEGIITSPIIQSAKEGNIAKWFFPPILVGFGVGFVFMFAPSSVVNAKAFWIGVLYLVAGGLFLVIALLGTFISNFSVLNTGDKKKKEIAVVLFIIVSILTILSVGIILGGSLIFTGDLIDMRLEESNRADLACSLTFNGCQNCDKRHHSDVEVCPEWENMDLQKILRTVMKQSSCLAFMLLIFAYEGLAFGFVLRRHISHYQIDYV